jgi:hypothetical protein
MKELIIVDNKFYKALIGIFSVLILYNLFVVFNNQNFNGVFPIVIQSVLMYFLLTKQPIGQKAVKIWIIVFLWGAQGLRIIGVAMQALSQDVEEDSWEMLTSNRIIYPLIFITIGMVIWYLNDNFGEVVEKSK